MNGPDEADDDLVEVVAAALSAMHVVPSGMTRPTCRREARVALQAAGRWLADRQAGMLGFTSSADDCCVKTKQAAADMVRYRTGAGAP